MRVLVIGDVVGRPGRRAVRQVLPGLRREYGVDLVIANGENVAGGFGATPDTVEELLEAGVDVLTSGNHVWDNRDILPFLEGEGPLLRPLNYPPGVPGRGCAVVKGALVVSLVGRVFVGNFDDPFRAMDQLLAQRDPQTRVVIVDFHAEATSEKGALAWYLDGRVSAVVGTHTHVPTADARILPRGTAFCSDAGMVGPLHSVIGSDPQEVIGRLMTQLPRRLNVAKGGPLQFNSLLIDVDEETGLARQIFRVDRETEG